MARDVRHRVTYKDRGPTHKHRWQATCTCGWKGIPLRVKKSAKESGEGHVHNASRTRRDSDFSNGRRPVTPEHLLPEGFRRQPDLTGTED